MEATIIKEYTNTKAPGSFQGLSNFFKSYKENHKVSKKQVQNALLQEDSYTLHKPTNKKFKSYSIIVPGINHTFQADLVDMKAYSKENKGFNYILTCIDCFRKKGWAIPLKDKTGSTVKRAFVEIFKDSIPKKLQTDKGTEFFNKEVQSYLKELGIKLYATNSNHKACIVERFNRTLKEKMWRFFTYNGNNQYIDELHNFIDSYNNTFHRSIKTTPNSVNLNNETEIWSNLYGYNKRDGNDYKMPELKFQIGDKVRIPKYRHIFTKGYTAKWTQEIFEISKIIPQIPPQFKIKDYEGEEIEGVFNQSELQKVYKFDDEYEIEEILKTRTRKGKKEYLVKWKGYDKTDWVQNITDLE